MKTSFQDDFDTEVERQSKELQCNDRERARGQSEYVMCIECGIGPCIAQTAFNRPSEPATDWEIERYAGYSPIVQGLIARIHVEAEARKAEHKRAADLALKMLESFEAQREAESTARSIRFNTILACADIVRSVARFGDEAGKFIDKKFTEERILSLLEPKS